MDAPALTLPPDFSRVQRRLERGLILKTERSSRRLSENAISEKTTTTYGAYQLKLTIYVVVRILDYEFSDSLLGYS
jgi:hypothetical protein